MAADSLTFQDSLIAMLRGSGLAGIVWGANASPYFKVPEPPPDFPYVVLEIPESEVGHTQGPTYSEAYKAMVHIVGVESNIEALSSPYQHGAVFHFLDSYANDPQLLSGKGFETVEFIRKSYVLAEDEGGKRGPTGERVYVASAQYDAIVDPPYPSRGDYHAVGFPQAPAVLVVVPLAAPTTKYSLSWLPVAGVNRYDLQRSVNAGVTWTDVAQVVGTSYGDSGLVSGGAYLWRVRSSTVKAVSQWSTAVGVPLVGLTVGTITESSITVNWTPNPSKVDADWSSDGGATWHNFLSNAQVNTATATGLALNTSYKIRVYPHGLPVTYGQTVPASTAVLQPPTNFAVTTSGITRDGWVISWSNDPGANHYQYQIQDTGGDWSSSVYDATATAGPVNPNTGGAVVGGQNYDLRIRSVLSDNVTVSAWVELDNQQAGSAP